MVNVSEQSVLPVIRAYRPTFRNSHDKAAFAVHATFVAAGFVLHATGAPAFADDALSSSSTEEVGIDNWNQYEGYYGFLYSQSGRGSKKIILKALSMNGKLLVDALQEGDSEPAHLEIEVDQYIPANEENNYNFKNFGKLVGDVEKELVHKYSDSPSTASSDQKSSSQKPSSSLESRSEEVDVQVPYSGDPSNTQPFQGYVVPPIPGIGGDDLFPGPGLGMYPGRGGFGGSGGMLVGPNDPRFGFDRDVRLPGGLPGNVPPGARFDPFGPPGVGGFEPGRFGNPRRPGRGGGDHPDLQHFRDGSDFI